MRDRTPKARETEPTIPAAPSPADEKLSGLHGLADKINRHRSELDAFLNEYAALLTTPGVPTVNLRMMLDGRGRCLCHSSMLAIAERVEALLLERKALERKALEDA